MLTSAVNSKDLKLAPVTFTLEVVNVMTQAAGQKQQQQRLQSIVNFQLVYLQSLLLAADVPTWHERSRAGIADLSDRKL